MTVPGRRRAWLTTAVVGLLVLIYLTSWSVYAAAHTGERYRQLAPGAAGSATDARWRLLSLVQTSQLEDASSGEPQTADAGAVFVVAALERVPERRGDFALCTANLLGSGGRVWEPSTLGVTVQRAARSCHSEDLEVGRAYRFETIYSIPAAYADQLAGVALPDDATADRTVVLRPPS